MIKDNSIIKSSVLSGIANGYRELAVTNEEILFPQFKKKLFNLESTECVNDNDYSDDSDWVRPAEFPDLSVIDLSEVRNCFVVSYDNKDRKAFCNIKAMFSAANRIYAETAYIENGVYTVIEENISGSSGSTSNLYKTFNTTGKDYDHDYIVVKIILPETVTGFGFTSGSSNGITYEARHQTAVEVIAKGYDTTSAQVGQGCPLATQFTKKSTVIGFVNWTQLSSAYTTCYELEEVEFINCSFDKVTTFNQMFDRCLSLKKIKGGLLHENLAACTNINAMFTLCYSLTNLDIDWVLPKLAKGSAGMFSTTSSSRLRYLKLKLDLSENNTSTGNALSIIGMANLRSIRKIDLSGSNFGTFITSLGNTFQNLYELREIDLSNIDLSKITSASSMCSSCRRLRKISPLSFSNSAGETALTTMAAAFSGCWCIEEIDISGISKVTTMATITAACSTLKKIKVRDVTSALTTISMKDMYSVREIDFDGCDLSSVTDTFATALTPTVGINFYNIHKLVINLSGTIDLKNGKNITEEDIQYIFGKLPDLTGLDSRTVNISPVIKRHLTSEDLEIATNKNWTVTTS